ncbi:DUF1194 domain-containing protein [Bradyrhizobium sp.]|uniref:DUF1194 domain-containing protein n=1 Tax=Bradyrhizobium sp. TaxID=376 RepID=UPI002D4D8294|nr:DUF1194 domain-containing protein [Bradyrhizobium sp.]HZR73957.1 DUF1194 domain-containing protein [Bradyrhizobium sp.]
MGRRPSKQAVKAIRVSLALLALAAALWAAIFDRGAIAADNANVDVQLVLAVDASGSVNNARFELQKQGYAAAFRNPQVIRAIASGGEQAIAVTMVQWTGPFLHVQAVPWTLIKDEASARAFADAIAAAPRELFGGGTSISGAIDMGMSLLAQSPYKSQRRTIDISGDGINNRGRSVTDARDDAVAAGIGINGLPILSLDPALDTYYRNSVIGGPGAFMIPAADYENFADAILKKLILEIAGDPNDPNISKWGAVLAKSP